MSDIPEEVPDVQPTNSDVPKSKFDFSNILSMLKKYKSHILIILIAILSYFVYKKKFCQVSDFESE